MKDLKVRDIMKIDAAFCQTTDNLMRVADTMRQRDCGIVPIVDENKKLVGVLTDRDLCLVVVARNRKASDIEALEIIKGKVVACAAEDKLEDALRKMRRHQIKRLVVVGEENELIGIFSITDVLPFVRKNKSLKKKIYATLKAIFKPRPIVLREISERENSDADENL